MTVAVVGQPSTGKSTFFTYITGKVERVASWPGTTVERRVASVEYGDARICLVDLPGIYGLTASSPEELVTKKFLLSGSYDLVLALVDPLVIERSIYLPLQLVEMGVKLVVAVTKWDVVHKSGLHVDVGKASSRLGVPVVPISSISGEGIDTLLSTIVEESKRRSSAAPGRFVEYGPLEAYVEKLASRTRSFKNPLLPHRWVALRLLEGDEDVAELLEERDAVEYAKNLREEFRKVYGVYPEDLAVYARYRKASEVLESAVVRVSIGRRGKFVERFDRIFVSPALGPIASLLTLFSIFLVAFTVNTGFPLNLVLRTAGLDSAAALLEEYSLSGLLGLAFTTLGSAVEEFLSSYSTVLAAVVADGVIASVGFVLSFAPLILVVSLLISVLEDSGIGPRMAHSLHRFLSTFGLSGRSLYPLVLGFGCSVPAVMQSRVALDRYERLQVIASAPYVICQARLAVLMYFTQYVFPGRPLLQSALMLSLYVVSVVLFLATSSVLRSLVFKVRERPEFLMEIPPLHRPSARVVWWNSWIRVGHFLAKAGTTIFAMVLASWLLVSLGPEGFVEDTSKSYAATVGTAFGRFAEVAYGVDPSSSWKVGYAIFYGALAKEGLITSIAMLSAVEEAEALEVLNLSLPQAVSLLFFFMFYIPCLPTIGVIYQESGSARYALALSMYFIVVSLAISVLIYYTLTALA
ncbi:MAG: ferrous iron transport protein B [Sulfolobales archaeon]|nr:ferrous iron transport protein B [Sulfolobales archaeon]